MPLVIDLRHFEKVRVSTSGISAPLSMCAILISPKYWGGASRLESAVRSFAALPCLMLATAGADLGFLNDFPQKLPKHVYQNRNCKKTD